MITADEVARVDAALGTLAEPGTVAGVADRLRAEHITGGHVGWTCPVSNFVYAHTGVRVHVAAGGWWPFPPEFGGSLQMPHETPDLVADVLDAHDAHRAVTRGLCPPDCQARLDDETGAPT